MIVYTKCFYINSVSIYPNTHLTIFHHILTQTHTHTHTHTHNNTHTHTHTNTHPHTQMYPMAVVGTASRGIVIYQLEGTPSEFRVSLSVFILSVYI